MPKVNIKLDKRRPLDGTDSYPLVFTISHKGKTAPVQSGFHLTEKEWGYLQDALAGNRRKTMKEKIIEEKFLRLKRAMDSLADGARADSAAALREMILQRERSGFGVQEPEDTGTTTDGGTSFILYYSSLMEEQQNKGTRDIYLRTKKLIERFCHERGSDPETLGFNDIDAQWLREFNEWMSPTNGVNSRSINLRNIRAAFNAAIDDGMKVEYPFSRVGSKSNRRSERKKFRIETDNHPKKRNLNINQLRTLKDIELPPWQQEYRDMFMLMFYLIGINSVDLLTARPDQLRDGRLEYDRRKTGTPYSIKVEPEAMALIQKYRGKRFLLSPCERYKDYRDYLHHMNDALKKIGIRYENRQKPSGTPLFPKLSTYWARHSWSSIAANIGILKDINGRAMGHAWARNTVTDIYINMDPALIDKANRAVIDAVCKNNHNSSKELL